MATGDVDKYKTLVSNLENELKSKGKVVYYWKLEHVVESILNFIPENKNSMLEAEIRSLQRRLVRRDNEILKQERELHKLRVSKKGKINMIYVFHQSPDSNVVKLG